MALLGNPYSPEHPVAQGTSRLLTALRTPGAPFLLLVQHRHLVWALLKRDLQSSIRGSILGLAWFVITPLVMVAIYTFVFGVILKSTWLTETGNPLEVPLIYFCGLTVFSFFMEVITRAPEYLRANRTYVTKIVFPIEILDLIIVGVALIKLVSSLLLLGIFLLLVTGAIPAYFLLIPLIIFPLIMFVSGLAWFITALGTYLRDVNQLLVALGPILMFISPIFYSIAQIPEGLRFIFWLNPLTFTLETLRGMLFFETAPDWGGYGLFCAASYLVMISGFSFFQRVRRGFADVI